jgi:hypothetical protein
MSCARAVQVARNASSLRGLRVIRGPGFGAGGFGGPFRAGNFSCFLFRRGSDFRLAYCAWRQQAIYFYSHLAFV